MPDLPTTPREVYARLPPNALSAIDRRPLERLIAARQIWEAASAATARSSASRAKRPNTGSESAEPGVGRVRSERFELSLDGT